MLRSGEYLLDTNAVIAMIGEQAAFQRQFTSAKTFLSATAVGELYYGAFKSANVQQNIRRVENLISGGNIRFCDLNTTRVYGLIKQQLRSKGKPIPDNDIWIAALAIQHDLVLATRDAHFINVQDLVVQAW